MKNLYIIIHIHLHGCGNFAYEEFYQGLVRDQMHIGEQTNSPGRVAGVWFLQICHRRVVSNKEGNIYSSRCKNDLKQIHVLSFIVLSWMSYMWFHSCWISLLIFTWRIYFHITIKLKSAIHLFLFCRHLSRQHRGLWFSFGDSPNSTNQNKNKWL